MGCLREGKWWMKYWVVIWCNMKCRNAMEMIKTMLIFKWPKCPVFAMTSNPVLPDQMKWSHRQIWCEDTSLCFEQTSCFDQSLICNLGPLFLKLKFSAQADPRPRVSPRPCFPAVETPTAVFFPPKRVVNLRNCEDLWPPPPPRPCPRPWSPKFTPDTVHFGEKGRGISPPPRPTAVPLAVPQHTAVCPPP